MDDIARASFNECLNRMWNLFCRVSHLETDQAEITMFIEAKDEATGLLGDLAKEDGE